jgi:hypothetical protein
MKPKITPILENVAESTAACLITMAQGNIFAIGLSHWLIASQTGVVAGLVATVAIVATQTDKRWLISALLGIATAIVDFYMHPGNFSSVATEAIGAAFLSYVAGTTLRYIRSRQTVTS